MAGTTLHKSARLSMIVCLGPAAAGLPGWAQPADWAETTIGNIQQTFAAVGYECEAVTAREGEEPAFVAAGEGKVRRLIGLRAGGTVIHCIAWFTIREDAKARALEAINRANEATYIGKYYVDGDGDLAVEYALLVGERFSPGEVQALDRRFDEELAGVLVEQLQDMLQ